MSNLDAKLTDGLSTLSKLFQRKEKVSLGVDIGATSIKIVELERIQNRFTLKNYATINVKQDLIRAGTPGLINPQTGTILAEIFKRLNVRSKKINVAVPSFSALITAMEIPALEESEIDSLISVEAPKYIPIPLKEVVYGWQLIPLKATDETKAGLKNGMSKILLVALMNDVSKKYEEVLSSADFHVNCIEVDSFSIKRALVGNDPGTYLILDVGEKISNIIITYNGSVAISRNIDVAGSRITEVIARSMNVTMEKADQLKMTSGLGIDQQFGSDIIGSALHAILTETKKAIELFYQSYPGEAVAGVILNGGTSMMPGFKDYIEKGLSLKTIIGNPWARISYPPNLQSTLMSYGTFFSVAIGLALLGFEEHE